jgi:uncharacterized protein with PIN domain
MPAQTSQKEEEYFARVELEKRRKHAEQRSKTIAEEEKRSLRDLHFMRCPKCGMELKEIDYKGVKVDKCFSCDGAWFDAGEIDALMQLDKSTLDILFSVFRK